MKFNGKELAEKIELSRRNFIKLLVGGAAGIHMTPLPWKLMDDSAIWTQNWSWLPVPPVGEFSLEKTICKLCPGGCGIEVRKVDDRPVKIEGRTDYPVNPGGICPLGAGGLQLLYNENIRFTSPMKRIGTRGEGKFAVISWDEALEELSYRIKKLRRKNNPEAIAAVDGNLTGSSMALLIQRLMEALGSPNYLKIPTIEDTYRTLNKIMTGNESPMAYDLENSDFILSFGCGLIEGWGSPGRMLHAWNLWHSEPVKGKVKIVQVESRASNTASKADMWVAPFPGTEAALALGLAHVIIKQGLYDAEFINNYSFGFADWADSNGGDRKGFKTLVIEKYSPEKVAKITGLNAKDIVFLAKDFARAKAPIALTGQGKGELNGNLLESMAVQSLNALMGNINKPGGVLVHEPMPLAQLPDFEPDEVSKKGMKKPRLDQAGSANFPFSRSLINNFTETLMEKPESPIDTLLVFSANPAYTLPDGGSFGHALKKIPFIVSFSPYKDETAMMADLILPDHTHLEKRDDIVCPTGLQYPLYGLSRPVLEPIYDTKNAGDVLIELAGKISESVGDAFPWEDFESVMKERAKGLYKAGGGVTEYEGTTPAWKTMSAGKAVESNYDSVDDMWDAIMSGGLWYRPSHKYKNWGSIFKTSTGKFEFCSSIIELALKESSLGMSARGDEAVMPHFEGPSANDKDKQYPLLMMPYGLINISTKQMPNAPYLNKTLFDNQLLKDESFIDLNPKTASKYGLKQGDRVIIESAKGKAHALVNLFEGAMPGVVFMPMGFGHSAYDDFQKGKGANPNNIINAGKAPISGQPIWWNTRVQLMKG